MIKGQRLKEEDNLLEILANKGVKMTFDNEGLPMIQKQAKLDDSLIETPGYEVSKQVSV